ncbi:MAG: exodeoxyribonuclease III [Betaproteobacteria bacterium]|nr:exodeoxyribonuclease III [Betaproteobacteria bacterium]
MKLATWNVNSLKVRLPHLLEFLARHSPDALCLQETKCEDAAFPASAVEAAGYRWVHDGQKTYNGVAILSREEPRNVTRGIPGFADLQKRVIAADVGEARVVSVYCPNGQSVGSDKYDYKLRWFEALAGWLAGELAPGRSVAVLGDYNVAPEDRDVHDPEAWRGQVLVSDAEREALGALLGLGFSDAFRLFEQPENSFSWWDYRMAAFRRNMGLRIDHILLSPALAGRCRSCTIDVLPRKLERPSDHAPVLCEIGA